jgi:hypothetical protein
MAVTDECWHFAQNCERWAAEEKDSQVRNAFYKMARSFAQLAFQERDASDATGLISSDAEAALTLLALGLTSDQQSVPASRSHDGRERHPSADATVKEPQKHGNPRPRAEWLPDAIAKGFSTPPKPNEADDASK